MSFADVHTDIFTPDIMEITFTLHLCQLAYCFKVFGLGAHAMHLAMSKVLSFGVPYTALFTVLDHLHFSLLSIVMFLLMTSYRVKLFFFS